MLKTKHLKKELVEIMTTLLENVVKYGTDEFESEFNFQHNGVPYKVEHVEQLEHDRIEIKIVDYYGFFPMFHVFIKQIPEMSPRLQAVAFVNANPHLVQNAYRVLKRMN